MGYGAFPERAREWVPNDKHEGTSYQGTEELKQSANVRKSIFQRSVARKMVRSILMDSNGERVTGRRQLVVEIE